MIDIRKLKELVKLTMQNDLPEMDLRDSEEHVTLQRPNQWATPLVQQAAAPQASVAVAPPPAVAAAAATPPPVDAGSAPDRSGLVAIESPMVGTYYSAASPDADPFVALGMDIGEQIERTLSTRLTVLDWESLGRLVRRTTIEAVATHFADEGANAQIQPAGKDATRKANGSRA